MAESTGQPERPQGGGAGAPGGGAPGAGGPGGDRRGPSGPPRGRSGPGGGGGFGGGDRGGDRGGPGGDRGGDRGGPGGRRFPRRFHRGKVCQFCVDKAFYVDYKDLERLARYVSPQGKILPRRMVGCCSRHMRMLTTAVKRARMVALLPFAAR